MANIHLLRRSGGKKFYVLLGKVPPYFSSKLFLSIVYNNVAQKSVLNTLILLNVNSSSIFLAIEQRPLTSQCMLIAYNLNILPRQFFCIAAIIPCSSYLGIYVRPTLFRSTITFQFSIFDGYMQFLITKSRKQSDIKTKVFSSIQDWMIFSTLMIRIGLCPLSLLYEYRMPCCKYSIKGVVSIGNVSFFH